MAVIPNTNVNLATNIRDVLNAAGGSVTNDVTTFFKTDAKINWKSRHKPLIYSKDFCQDFDAARSDYDLNWTNGNSGTWGLTPHQPYAIPYEAGYNEWNDLNYWVYNLPTGGSSQPLRVSDFCGYDTDAKPPVYSFESQKTSAGNILPDDGFYFNLGMNPSGGNGIALADTYFKDYYMGVVLRPKSDFSTNDTSVWKQDIASGKIGTQTNLTIKVSTWNMKAGQYIAVPFLSKKQVDTGDRTNTIYNVPGILPLKLQVVDGTDSLDIAINISRSTMRIWVDITVTHLGGTGELRFNNNIIKVRPLGYNYDDALTQYDYTESIPYFTLTEGQSYSYDSQIIFPNEELDKGGWVYVGLMDSLYIASKSYL